MDTAEHTANVKEDVSPLHALRRWLFPGRDAKAAQFKKRITALTRAISRDPEMASGYVMRGELYLSAGLWEYARRDFQRALEITDRQLDTERWGVVAQVMRDRALSGLDEAIKINP